MRYVLSEETAKFWTVIFDGVKALGFVIAGLWVLYVFFHQENVQSRQSVIEAEKPFYAHQLDTYVALSTAAARVAATEPIGSEGWKKELREFTTIVDGPLTLVSDPAVNTAVRNFYNCDSGQAGCGEVGHYAREIARSCRASLTRTWKVEALGY